MQARVEGPLHGKKLLGLLKVRGEGRGPSVALANQVVAQRTYSPEVGKVRPRSAGGLQGVCNRPPLGRKRQSVRPTTRPLASFALAEFSEARRKPNGRALRSRLAEMRHRSRHEGQRRDGEAHLGHLGSRELRKVVACKRRHPGLDYWSKWDP